MTMEGYVSFTFFYIFQSLASVEFGLADECKSLQTCWFNTGVFMTTFAMQELRITLDEVPEDASFMGIFKSWFVLPTSQEKESRPALTAFITEFLAGDMGIFDQYQEGRLFFSGLAPNAHNNSEGVPLMDFMRPTSITTVTGSRCGGCMREGYRRPGNLAVNVAFDIHLPAEADRAENESLQSLVNGFFNTRRVAEPIDCECKAQVDVITSTEIVDPKRAVIIHIDRFLPTPENDITGITGMCPHTAQICLSNSSQFSNHLHIFLL